MKRKDLIRIKNAPITEEIPRDSISEALCQEQRKITTLEKVVPSFPINKK